MKITYQAPESQIIWLSFEMSVLSTEKTTGGNTGSNMDDPDYQNPF